MPNVKVCLWNIQDYSQPSGKYNGTAAGSALRNSFISSFVHRHAIDVLMIQEVKNAGAQVALANLVTQLNAPYPPTQRDWAYSWCGCAVRSSSVDTVTSAADLTDKSAGRYECYGVVWRRRQTTRFTMIQAVNAIAYGSGPPAVLSPLNISQFGRPTGNVLDELGQETFGATGGFTLANPYPYRLDPMNNDYEMLDHWPKLNYPYTANNDPLGLQWAHTRRPAYVVLKLNNGTLCPVAAYHAPSNQMRSSWGAWIAGLAREIYAINTVDAHDVPVADEMIVVRKGVFGGDFNLSVDQADWAGSSYSYFTAVRRRNYDGGGHCLDIPVHTDPAADRRTTVQLLTGHNHDDPIIGANTNDYLRYMIDIGFYPRNVGITGERVDLLTEIMNNPGNAYDVPLTRTAAYMAHVEAQVANNRTTQRLPATGTGPQEKVTKRKRGEPEVIKWVPIIKGAWGGTFRNWTLARQNYAAHNIITARCAAEYIHIFVSDHLPLILTIPI